MRKLSVGLKEYYHEIASVVPCSGREKRQYLSELKHRLYGMKAEGTPDDYETAKLLWGTPDEIVEAWEEYLSITDPDREARLHRWGRAAFLGAVTTGALLLILLGSFFL